MHRNTLYICKLMCSEAEIIECRYKVSGDLLSKKKKQRVLEVGVPPAGPKQMAKTTLKVFLILYHLATYSALLQP